MSGWMELDIFFNWSTVEDSQCHIYFLYNTYKYVDNRLFCDFIFSFLHLIPSKFILWSEPTISADNSLNFSIHMWHTILEKLEHVQRNFWPFFNSPGNFENWFTNCRDIWSQSWHLSLRNDLKKVRTYI